MIVLHEEVFAGVRGCQHVGSRVIFAEVLGDGMPGFVRLRVVRATGKNVSLPVGEIQRPKANIKNAKTADVPQLKKGGSTDVSQGTYLVGPKHSEGGIPVKNKGTGENLEVEGGEVVITAPAVEDPEKRWDVNGKKMTNREMLSAINESGGGVSLEKGGDIKSCRYTGKTFEVGGKTMTDLEILNKINECGCDHSQAAILKTKYYDDASALNAGTITIDEFFNRLAEKHAT